MIISTFFSLYITVTTAHFCHFRSHAVKYMKRGSYSFTCPVSGPKDWNQRGQCLNLEFASFLTSLINYKKALNVKLEQSLIVQTGSERI